LRKNISLNPSGKSFLQLAPSCPKRGALRNVINAGGDAVDADAPRDERRSLRTVKSCGPDAPTLASSFVDGDVGPYGPDTPASAKRRGQKSPVPGESPKETVKTIRVRECRVIPVRPW
jgi:hypothetical protein